MADASSCSSCSCSVSLEDNYCSNCGKKLNVEEIAIKFYFKEGYEYYIILKMLEKFHGIHMSMRTLKSRLKAFGLRRRSLRFDEGETRARIQQELDGPGCMAGYRSICHTLRRENFDVPRQAVANLLQEMDPEGCDARRRRRLRRRLYVNQGPNHCWHMDGYDKLKPYGFPIHGCIDGYSRKMLWLRVARTNNNPSVVADSKVRTDCGTENGIVAAAQCYFMNDPHAHVYGTSPHNQRIEGWWSYLRRSRMTWWINFFKDLMEQGIFTPGNQLQMECLWFCFSGIIQQDLDIVLQHWNSHYIRRSRHDTVSGRPDELFYLPELHSGKDLLHQVSTQECQYVKENYLSLEESRNEFQEYFEYVMEAAVLQQPKGWREALHLYQELQLYAVE